MNEGIKSGIVDILTNESEWSETVVMEPIQVRGQLSEWFSHIALELEQIFALDGVIDNSCILIVAHCHMDSHKYDSTLES